MALCTCPWASIMVVTWGLYATLRGSLPCQGLLWRINRPSECLCHVWCLGACVCPALCPGTLTRRHWAVLASRHADIYAYTCTCAYTCLPCTHMQIDSHLIKTLHRVSEWLSVSTFEVGMSNQGQHCCLYTRLQRRTFGNRPYQHRDRHVDVHILDTVRQQKTF